MSSLDKGCSAPPQRRGVDPLERSHRRSAADLHGSICKIVLRSSSSAVAVTAKHATSTAATKTGDTHVSCLRPVPSLHRVSSIGSGWPGQTLYGDAAPSKWDKAPYFRCRKSCTQARRADGHSSELRSEPQRQIDQAADGLGACDGFVLRGDKCVNQFELPLVHAHLQLKCPGLSSSGVRPFSFWVYACVAGTTNCGAVKSSYASSRFMVTGCLPDKAPVVRATLRIKPRPEYQLRRPGRLVSGNNLWRRSPSGRVR